VLQRSPVQMVKDRKIPWIGSGQRYRRDSKLALL